MKRALFRPTLPRGLAWLLALALWLPAAQLVATAHAFRHLHAISVPDRSPDEPLPAACDLCVVAAAITAAAPPAAALPVLPPALPHAQPAAPIPAGERVAASTPYRSRAPPFPHA